MPQEPKSFFERITGAKVMGDNEALDYADPEAGEEVEIDSPDDEVAVEQAMEEPEEVMMEESYSDEDTGAADTEAEGQLTVDVFQDDQNIVIQSTIAGVSPEDLDVSITNDMVTIRGERRQAFEIDQEDYFYQECYWGTFSRSVILPVEIDADRAEAKIKNGVLTIRIPKANAAVTRKLKVKAT